MAEAAGQGFSDLISTIKNGVTNLGQILKVISQSFPQIVGTSTSATAGAQTLPANPAGFLSITLPDGTAAKVPYYNT